MIGVDLDAGDGGGVHHHGHVLHGLLLGGGDQPRSSFTEHQLYLANGLEKMKGSSASTPKKCILATGFDTTTTESYKGPDHVADNDVEDSFVTVPNSSAEMDHTAVATQEEVQMSE